MTSQLARDASAMLGTGFAGLRDRREVLLGLGGAALLAGADGTVRFRTILPGCYGGRAPHLHFEVFSSAAAAATGQPGVLASQFALTHPRRGR